jgi:hypothetical protein
MIESLRAVGYSPETAVADLIDNSIAAHARNVWVRFHWDGERSHVAVIDDGRGMDPATLTQAMVPGTHGPLEERPPGDLGRFGLGLKTASFSQARRLTVVSRPADGIASCRRWDLDYVQELDDWLLLTEPAQASEQWLEPLDDMPHGTIVLWEQMDRVVGNLPPDRDKAQDRFLEILRDVEDHLAMVFHRYLDGPKPRLSVWLDAGARPKKVQAWDPFLENHMSTLAGPPEQVSCCGGCITVRGFVLPHKSKFDTPEDHRRAGGPHGWNARQGFYVYRNERLVVPGSWLGLGVDRQWVKEEHYKLARIRVDIPNTMDLDWQLDVKKSDARPPAEVRGRLRQLAVETRATAVEVYRFRGGLTRNPKAPQRNVERPWLAKTRDDRIHYAIDRKHPLVRLAREQLGSDVSSLEGLLRLLEETIPVQTIWIDAAEKDQPHTTPFEFSDDEELVRIARLQLSALRGVLGLSASESLQRLRTMEPFDRYPDVIDGLGNDE